MTNGFREGRKPSVRRGQAAIVDAIFGYLSDGAPATPMPMDAAAGQGEVDSEDLAPADDHAEGRVRELEGKGSVDL